MTEDAKELLTKIGVESTLRRALIKSSIRKYLYAII